MTKLTPPQALRKAIKYCGGITGLSRSAHIGRTTIYDALNRMPCKQIKRTFVTIEVAKKIGGAANMDWRLFCVDNYDYMQDSMHKEIKTFINNPDKTKSYNLKGK